MSKPRVYVDTSVFGGVFDKEFSGPSRAFFSEVEQGNFILVTSAVVQSEIALAPISVQDFFSQSVIAAELAEINQQVLALREAYIEAGVVTPKSMDDAAHVALASISGCQMIVSWNFKHIVHFEKIPKYNAINIAMGYSQLDIYSPLEVIHYDNS